MSEQFDDYTADMLSASFALLEKIRIDRGDPIGPNAISHLFYGQEVRLRRMAKLLVEKGFELVEISDGRCGFSEEAVLSEQWIWARVPEMQQVAGEFEAIYDGWDVDVSREVNLSN